MNRPQGPAGIQKTTIVELLELLNAAERALAGSSDAATAHGALRRVQGMTGIGQEELSAAYEAFLERLGVTSAEVQQVFDYLKDREALLSEHAVNLERTIAERDEEIARRIGIERELRLTEEKFRGFFEHAVEGMFQTTADGRFVTANNALARVSGYGSPEELMEAVTNLGDQLYARPEDRVEFMRRLSEHGEVSRFEVQFRHRDGSLIWASVSARAVRGPDGRVVLLEGTCEDVTARKAAEDEVRRLTEDLEERVEERTADLQEANRELEAFAYSISHDLRAPLRAIDGFSQILLEDYGDVIDSVGQSHLERVRSGSQRMGRLIDHILRLSRLTRHEPKNDTVDLSTMARSVLDELLQAATDRNVQTVVADDLEVITDPVLIRSVLENLIGNALKFTRDRDPAVVEFGVSEKDGKRRFYVRDNGVGFQMEHTDNLFGIFNRLHKKEGFAGDGIGLASVNRMITKLRGTVWAEGVPGEGATFFFTL